MLTQVKDWLLDSPLGKTIGFFISVILSGVLSGSLITEITIAGKLDWSMVYKTKSFYGLLVLLILVYLYNHLLYQKEINIRNFMDVNYCRAYMKSKALPELAKKYKVMLDNGNSIQNLSDWEKELDKMLEEK